MEKQLREAKRAALKKLSGRSCHSREIERLLAEKGFSSKIGRQVVEELRQIGYLEDPLFLEAYIRYQTERKYGPGRIVQKLVAKGLSFSEASEAVREQVSEEMQREAVRQLLERRLKNRDDKRKTAAFLARRGFDAAIINEFLINALTVEI